MIVLVSGNSIPLQIYPKRHGTFTFPQILKSHYMVITTCGIKKTVNDGYRDYVFDIVCHYPDWVVLSYGIVECFPTWLRKSRMSKEAFKFYLEGIIKSVRFMCDAKFLLLGILPVSKHWATSRMTSNIYSFNKIINETAKELAAEFLDVSDMHNYVLPQGFHLNPEGHEEMARRIDKCLNC